MSRPEGRPAAILAFFAALLAAFLLLPVLLILVQGLSGAGRAALAEAAVREALGLSLLTTGLTALCLVGFVTPVAWLLARSAFPGKRLLEALLDLPTVLPPVVAGLGLLLVFGRNGLLGPPLEIVGIELAFSTAAVVLAQLFVAAPLYLRAAKTGFMAASRGAEEAARSCGATPWQSFWRVTLPLAWPFLLEGLALAWGRALGEFGATMLFAGSLAGRTRTMPLAIYSALESDIGPALLLSALLSLVAFGLLWLVRRF